VSPCPCCAARVAANDHVVTTPDQWLQRHDMVLTNLTGWEGVGVVVSHFKSINVAVHDHIPFLTGPSAERRGGALIITATSN